MSSQATRQVMGFAFSITLAIFCSITLAASTKQVPDPTIASGRFEGIGYSAEDISRIRQAYGINSPMIHYQCALPVKRALSDASACRVRCSDGGSNIVDVFALDQMAVGKAGDGRDVMILSRTDNYDGVQENGGVVVLNRTASCFFQGMKIVP